MKRGRQIGLHHNLWRKLRNTSTAGMLLVCWVVLALSNPHFLTRTNITNVFTQSANLAIVAMVLTIVIVAGEIDLSVGSVEALGSAVVSVLMVNLGLPVFAAIPLAIVAGLAAGAFNGGIRVVFGVPSFVTTLAMLSIASGFALVVTNGLPIYGLPNSFLYIGQGSIVGVPVAVLIASVVALLLHVMMTRSRFGLYIQVLGDSEWAARSVGLPVNRIRVGVLAISGGLSAVAGMIVAAEIESGNATIGFSDLLFALAAVVIGGTSLFGGVGTIGGTILGVLLIGSLQNGLDLFNIQAYWQQVVIGAMIAAAVVFDYILRPREESADW